MGAGGSRGAGRVVAGERERERVQRLEEELAGERARAESLARKLRNAQHLEVLLGAVEGGGSRVQGRG